MKGLEPSTFCMAKRPGVHDERQPSTTNARNHAGLRRYRRSLTAWLLGRVPGRLGHEWGTVGSWGVADSGMSHAAIWRISSCECWYGPAAPHGAKMSGPLTVR